MDNRTNKDQKRKARRIPGKRKVCWVWVCLGFLVFWVFFCFWFFLRGVGGCLFVWWFVVVFFFFSKWKEAGGNINDEKNMKRSIRSSRRRERSLQHDVVGSKEGRVGKKRHHCNILLKMRWNKIITSVLLLFSCLILDVTMDTQKMSSKLQIGKCQIHSS